MGLEHWTFRQNVPKNKMLLKNLRQLLTNEIQRRKAQEPEHLDFRFLLPLAQWLCEQGGYTITPKGNNPGNVMGKGDVGNFHRANNVEIVDGKPVILPANFARFSTMEVGTKATFDHLQERWFGAYTQILDGGSPEAFVTGLYPGRGKNYATQFQSVYTSGVRLRYKRIVEDFLLILDDDLKDLEKQRATVIPVPSVDERGRMSDGADDRTGKKPQPGVHRNRFEAHLMGTQVKIEDQRKAEFEKRKTMLEEQKRELKEIVTKFKL